MELSGEPSVIIVLGGNVGERFYHFASSTILDKQERHWLTCLSWRTFYRPAKRKDFDGVGWGGDVNVHWHLHTYVMLRHCTFFCNFHTYVMLRWGGVGWGGDVNVLLQLPHIRDATLGWGGVGMLRSLALAHIRSLVPNYNKRFHESESENPRELLKTTATFIKQLSWFAFGPLEEEKTLRGLSMEKLNPQVRRPLFFSQNLRFPMAKR